MGAILLDMKLFNIYIFGVISAQDFCITDSDCANVMESCKTSKCFCDEGLCFELSKKKKKKKHLNEERDVSTSSTTTTTTTTTTTGGSTTVFPTTSKGETTSTSAPDSSP